MLYSESASCTHISALLHALAGLAPSTFSLGVQGGSTDDDEEETVPVTSQLCKWNVPQKRKDSAMPMSKVVFEKHDYSKPNKRRFKSFDDFDPRPPEFRGTAASRLPTLLNNIRGQQLCISLLFDERCQYKPDQDKVLSGQDVNVPSLTSLKQTISAFKESLRLNDDQIREVEQATRDQRLSSRWYSERRFRITASNFGAILHRKESTPPDKLVLHILQQKTFSSPATQYGIANEPVAMTEYIEYQHSHGHTDLAVCPSGFNVCSAHPYLGASPDGAVYDPSIPEQPFGYLEIKCPFSARNIHPTEACCNTGFCCTLDTNTGCLVLKENHAVHGVIL